MTALLETTAPELDELNELEIEEPDLDDFGADVIDEDFDGLSSDVDNWDSPDDYYGSSYGADRSYLFSLLR